MCLPYTHKLISSFSWPERKGPYSGPIDMKNVRRYYWCRPPETCLAGGNWKCGGGDLKARRFVLVARTNQKLWDTQGQKAGERSKRSRTGCLTEETCRGEPVSSFCNGSQKPFSVFDPCHQIDPTLSKVT